MGNNLIYDSDWVAENLPLTKECNVNPSVLGTLTPDIEQIKIIKIEDTFKIGWFKKIPLVWILEEFRGEYTIDVTKEGVAVYTNITSDRKEIKRDIYRYYKCFIKKLYERELKIEKLKGIIKPIADEICKKLGVEYKFIRFYTEQSEDPWAYCMIKERSLNFDYKAYIDMPYQTLYNHVLHECCHLKIEGHGEDFWQEYKKLRIGKPNSNFLYIARHGHKHYYYPFGDGETGLTYHNRYNDAYYLKFNKKVDYKVYSTEMVNKS